MWNSPPNRFMRSRIPVSPKCPVAGPQHDSGSNPVPLSRTEKRIRLPMAFDLLCDPAENLPPGCSNAPAMKMPVAFPWIVAFETSSRMMEITVCACESSVTDQMTWNLSRRRHGPRICLSVCLIMCSKSMLSRRFSRRSKRHLFSSVRVD